MASTILDSTLGDIVAHDYRAAAVLNRFDLDFCCGGKRTLAEACRLRRIDADEVAAAVSDAAVVVDSPTRDDDCAIDELIDLILAVHHSYVRAALPRIAAYLEKLTAAHGARHPELRRIADHFAETAAELTQHMFKEEQVLFPYLRALHAAAATGADAPPNCFGSVRNPIRMMEAEHANAGSELEIIRELSDKFAVPSDGCATFQVCYQELAAFDADLRRHIHLENNVLFPKAIDLERRLADDGGGIRLA